MITNHYLLRSSVVNNLLAQLDLGNSSEELIDLGLTVGKAILVLVIGLIITNIIKGQVKRWLDKTDIDNKIAGWIAGESQASSLPIEEWISEVVGWVLTLFVVLAFFDVLQLEVVSQPLNALLQDITQFLPRIGSAALLLLIAWALGTIVKLIITNTFSRLQIDKRLNQQMQETEDATETEETASVSSEEDNLNLGETIGNALYWLIFLLFLPSVLSVLQLEGTLRPVEELVNDILSIIPNILGAVIIAAVGWVIAQIIKKVVTNLLKASGINQIGAKFGLGSNQKGQSLAQIIGSVVYVLVLIPIAITALDALQIQAISEPATEMLNQVLDILPKLFSSLVILGLAYVGGQYLSELITNLLASIGFNNVTQWLGLAAVTSATSEEESPPATTTQTPSQIVGVIVLVAVMLVASLTAVDILEIEALRDVFAFILILSGQVLAGMLVFAVGLYLANLVFNLISNSGTSQANFLAQTARIAIIVLVSAMALERIGIAPNIVNLAFGLLTAGIAVAIALAFGLGGREAAGKALQEWLENLKDE